MSQLTWLVFLPCEAEVVLGIPISPSLLNDSRIWAWSNNRRFTVKSAYEVALNVLNEASGKGVQGECSDTSKMTATWKSIWKLDCANKIKHFLWRACKDSLPTNFCLVKRKVSTWDGCVWCGEKETSSHALWECRVAADAWKESGLRLPRWKNSHSNFFEVYWRIREEANGIDWNFFATLAWGIWNGRNLYKHEGKGKTARTLVCEASNFAAAFKQSSTKACPPSTQLPHRGSQWRPPENGWYKINVDGAVFKEEGSCGVGVVIRNDVGCLMGAMSKNLPFPLGPMEAEARAVEEGIILAWEVGLDKVVVEGDAKTIMVALSDPTNDAFPSSILKNMEGAKSKLQNFQAWNAHYVHRSCNNAAHEMARHARNVLDYLVWVEDTPPMIIKQILKDVISMGLSQVE